MSYCVVDRERCVDTILCVFTERCVDTMLCALQRDVLIPWCVADREMYCYHAV